MSNKKSLSHKVTILDYCANLEQAQSSDPYNYLLAHDLGLAYYWQTKDKTKDKTKNNNDIWRKVIANWAIVLESDTYWKQWSNERSKIYGKPIKEKDISDVIHRIKEKIVSELVEDTKANSNIFLEAEFHRELRTISLLKKIGGFRSNKSNFLGYLFAQQLNLSRELNDIFKKQFEINIDKQDLLQVVFSYFQKRDTESNQINYSSGIQLQLCFSQLGTAFISIEQNNPLQALKILTSLKCTSCKLELNIDIDNKEILQDLPTKCDVCCDEFKKYNPAYDCIPSGPDLFFRHAVELIICSYLLLLYHELVDLKDCANLKLYLNKALDYSKVLGISKLFFSRINKLILSWAEGLISNKQYDEAIIIIEWIYSIKKWERSKRKLAELLNIRGVQKGEQKLWEDAVHDIRRAYELNPYAPLFRKNLTQALYSLASEIHVAGDPERANKLRDEAYSIESEIPTEEAVPEEEKEEEVALLSEFVLSESEIIHPGLFDYQGTLKYDVFNEQGKMLLEQACKEAANIGDEILRPAALLLALIRKHDGETTRLINMQKVSAEQIVGQIKKNQPNDRLLNIPALTQFDMWYNVHKILEIAWEVAQYDEGKIGEIHLLYGFLISNSVNKQLQAVGLNINKMIEQVGWN